MKRFKSTLAIAIATAVSTLIAEQSDATECAHQTSDSAQSVTFDQLKFKLRSGAEFRREVLPAIIGEIAGKRIQIKGYMMPASVFQAEGIRNFVLVRDISTVFGYRYGIGEVMLTHMRIGSELKYSARPIIIVGTFELEEHRVGERLFCVYKLTDAIRR